MRRSSIVFVAILILALSLSASAHEKVFVEENGLLVIEAEDYFASHTDPYGIYYWQVEYEIPGYSGTGHVTILPNIGGVSGRWDDKRAYLEYRVLINTPGVYHVLYRGYARRDHGNSIFVTVDDKAPNARLTCGPYDAWRICYGDDNGDAAVTYELTPGEHVVKLWVRETGESVDQIIFMLNPGPEWAPVPQSSDPLPAKAFTR